jgi:hypothetical protein
MIEATTPVVCMPSGHDHGASDKGYNEGCDKKEGFHCDTLMMMATMTPR